MERLLLLPFLSGMAFIKATRKAICSDIGPTFFLWVLVWVGFSFVFFVCVFGCYTGKGKGCSDSFLSKDGELALVFLSKGLEILVCDTNFERFSFVFIEYHLRQNSVSTEKMASILQRDVLSMHIPGVPPRHPLPTCCSPSTVPTSGTFQPLLWDLSPKSVMWLMMFTACILLMS